MSCAEKEKKGGQSHARDADKQRNADRHIINCNESSYTRQRSAESLDLNGAPTRMRFSIVKRRLEHLRKDARVFLLAAQPVVIVLRLMRIDCPRLSSRVSRPSGNGTLCNAESIALSVTLLVDKGGTSAFCGKLGEDFSHHQE